MKNRTTLLAMALLACGVSGVTQAQSCASPIVYNTFSPVAGNTCTGSNQLGTLCGAFSSPENDIVYTWTFGSTTPGTPITLTNGTPAWNPALVLLSGSCGGGVSCTDVADNNGAGAGETMPLQTGAGTYFLIVTSSPGSGGCGSFTVGFSTPVQLQSFTID